MDKNNTEGDLISLHEPTEPPPFRPIRGAAPLKYLRPLDRLEVLRQKEQRTSLQMISVITPGKSKIKTRPRNKKTEGKSSKAKTPTTIKVKKSEQKDYDAIFDRNHIRNQNRNILENLIKSYENEHGLPYKEVTDEDRKKLKPKIRHWVLRDGKKWTDRKAFGLRQTQNDMEIRKRRILQFKTGSSLDQEIPKRVVNQLGREVVAKPKTLSRWESGYKAIVEGQIQVTPIKRTENLMIHSSRTFEKSSSMVYNPTNTKTLATSCCSMLDEDVPLNRQDEPVSFDNENDDCTLPLNDVFYEMVSSLKGLSNNIETGDFLQVSLAEGPFGEGSGFCLYEEAIGYFKEFSNAITNMGDLWTLHHDSQDLKGIIPDRAKTQLDFIERNQFPFLIKVNNAILVDKFVRIWHLAVENVHEIKSDEKLDFKNLLQRVLNKFFEYVANGKISLPSLTLPWRKVRETYMTFEYGEDQEYKTILPSMIPQEFAGIFFNFPGTAMQKPWRSLIGTNLVMTHSDAVGFLPQFKVNSKSYAILLNKLLIMYAAGDGRRPHQVIRWRDIVRYRKMTLQMLPMSIGFVEKLKGAIKRERDMIVFTIYPIENQCGFAVATRSDKWIRVYLPEQFDSTFEVWEGYQTHRTVMLQNLTTLKSLIEETFGEPLEWCYKEDVGNLPWPWWDYCHQINVPKSTNVDKSPLLAAFGLERYLTGIEGNVVRELDEDDDNVETRTAYIKLLADTSLKYESDK